MKNFLRPALLSLSLLMPVMAVPALADGADNRPPIINGINGATINSGGANDSNGVNGVAYDYGNGYGGHGYNGNGYAGNGYGGHGGHYGYDRHILSEDQVRWRLRNQGFHRVHAIDHERGRYTARARDAYGRPVHVVVSARTGQVLHVRYR